MPVCKNGSVSNFPSGVQRWNTKNRTAYIDFFFFKLNLKYPVPSAKTEILKLQNAGWLHFNSRLRRRNTEIAKHVCKKQKTKTVQSQIARFEGSEPKAKKKKIQTEPSPKLERNLLLLFDLGQNMPFFFLKHPRFQVGRFGRFNPEKGRLAAKYLGVKRDFWGKHSSCFPCLFQRNEASWEESGGTFQNKRKLPFLCVC